MKPILDIHTHTNGHDRSLLCVDPSVCTEIPTQPFSVGIHPWNSAIAPEYYDRLSEFATDNNCIAIGETGLDRYRGSGLSIQENVLEHHIQLSQRTDKPLIIHCVRCFAEILAARRRHRLKSRQPWIIHGFRGKLELAGQLLDQGLHLSIGSNFNPGTVAMLPDNEILLETDDSPTGSINHIAEAIAAVRQTTPEAILSLAGDNASRLLNIN